METGLLTLTDTASYLVTTENVINKLAAAKAIPYHLIGGRRVFLQAELDEWLTRSPGVTVDQAIDTLGGREPPVETPTSPQHRAVNAAAPIKLVRAPVKPLATSTNR
jgi:hypothetical protein